MRSYARNMRHDATLAENLLWQAIRNHRLSGLKFRRQVPILTYIVDFACLKQRLIIELDGSQHCESAADVVRDEKLHSAGFKLLRFWNNEVLVNLDGVCSQILYEARLQNR
ncbi:DUF559 domain-containing protein [Phyllobacterium sp. YR531]|uniref:endonuclease domain-containing protein n=1 Tax=Phyllobacterium sp. YR531 TaxID=1144343 RepID=UPI0032976AFC